MSSSQLGRFLFAVAAILSFQAVGLAGSINLDLFDSTQSAEATIATPPTQGVGHVLTPAPSTLGDERDLFVSKVAGGEDERLRARVNPLGDSKLRIDADAEVAGSIYLTWDGQDGDANPVTGVDYNGLRGVDLAAAGDAFEIVVSFSDVGGPVMFSVFDNTADSGAAVATASLAIPAGIPANTPTAFELPFADFVGTTSALSDAGAVLMEVQNPDGAWDLNLQSVKVVPEPGSFALAGLGLLLALVLRTKRLV